MIKSYPFSSAAAFTNRLTNITYYAFDAGRKTSEISGATAGNSAGLSTNRFMCQN